MKRLLPYFERISEGTWRCVRPVTIAARGRVFQVAPEDTFVIGRVQGRFDIAFELECAYEHFWRPRDFEAQVLAELLRLSRLTLLYGAQGVGKTTLLKTGVLPLLRRSAEARNIAQDEKPRVLAPFPERRLKDAATGRSAEITVVFDRWADIPLTALHASIVDMLPVKGAGAAEPENLGGNLAAWNKEHGFRFFIILDGFEQYLHAPHDRAGIAEFEHELVRMINQPRLPAHFLLSLRDDAEPLLNRFKERINGFGHAFLRLPDLRCAAEPPVAARSRIHQAMPRVAASETPVTAPRELSMPPLTRTASSTGVPSARAGGTSVKPEHSQAGKAKFRFNALHSREVRRTSACILLAPGIAAFTAVLAAVFITIYGHQEASTSRPAAIERGAAAAVAPAADRPLIPVLTEVLAAPRATQVPAGLGDSEAPHGPSAIPVPARPKKPVSSAARRVPRPAKVKMAASVPKDWKTEMLHEIEACRAESFVSRIACVEHVRWKHCAPNRWNTIPACVAGTRQGTLLE
jgi:hypothetical protein